MLGVTFGEPPNALVLSDVFTDGPAFRAGIQIGDEILSLDNQDVTTADDVLSIVRSTRPGDQVVVRVRRAGDGNDFNITLCDYATIVALRSRVDSIQNGQPQLNDEESAEQ